VKTGDKGKDGKKRSKDFNSGTNPKNVTSRNLALYCIIAISK